MLGLVSFSVSQLSITHSGGVHLKDLSSARNSASADTESAWVATLSNILTSRCEFHVYKKFVSSDSAVPWVPDTHSPPLPDPQRYSPTPPFFFLRHVISPCMCPLACPTLKPPRGPPSHNGTYHQNTHYARILFNDSDGYLVRMFGARDAAFFLESLLKMDAQDVHLISNVPGWPNALMVERPSVSSTHPAAIANNQHPLWLLDFVPPPGSSSSPSRSGAPQTSPTGAATSNRPTSACPSFSCRLTAPSASRSHAPLSVTPRRSGTRTRRLPSAADTPPKFVFLHVFSPPPSVTLSLRGFHPSPHPSSGLAMSPGNGRFR